MNKLCDLVFYNDKFNVQEVLDVDIREISESLPSFSLQWCSLSSFELEIS